MVWHKHSDILSSKATCFAIAGFSGEQEATTDIIIDYHCLQANMSGIGSATPPGCETTPIHCLKSPTVSGRGLNTCDLHWSATHGSVGLKLRVCNSFSLTLLLFTRLPTHPPPPSKKGDSHEADVLYSCISDTQPHSLPHIHSTWREPCDFCGIAPPPTQIWVFSSRTWKRG